MHKRNKLTSEPVDQSRRRFVLGASTLMAASCLPFGQALAAPVPNWPAQRELRGREFDLNIGRQLVNFTGRERLATTVNQSLPAPLLRWREGDRVRINVRNTLDSASSIHWHGLILPSNMDGVPGLSFDGIAPGETFSYEFDLLQSGTYWYHSHSGHQEQNGLYGAIIIEPKDQDPVQYDREHVIVLSDWTDEDPNDVYGKLKKESHYYNFRRRTVADFFADLRKKGVQETYRDRAMWNDMRMSETDLADVTGYTYTFLMNGVTPDRGWQGLFKPGEKVRLRVVNAAAMTIFDLRIPGLKMTVVAADGQNVRPVAVDEFRIGPAETYDVIVEPQQEGAYTVFAQAIDRSGFARGTLASREDLLGEIPAMDAAPVLGHADMGMAHGNAGSDHSAHQPSHGDHTASSASDHRMHAQQNPGQDHSAHAGHGQGQHQGHGQKHDTMAQHHGHGGEHQPREDHQNHAGHQNHGGHQNHAGHQNHSGHQKREEHQTHGEHGQHGKFKTSGLGLAGFGSNNEIKHASTEFGPHVDMRAENPQSGLNDPGVGLREHHKLGRKVLTYGDLRGLHPTRDKRQPSREIQLHLTGNMNRYMWSFDGIPHHDAQPIQLEYGERLRIVLVNDTMMTHPIHLHGMWSELETGDPDYIPRKHTILVQPGSTISYLVTADAKGRWAYHCHLLFHMAGMMREVRVG
ncbi:copper resistance system multicopper oxidase [Proteobacteria bacterium 005FR1]|nr:copper resistance system multicopper oxidase [Proteobacteria bacterium 005FR1]